MPEYTRPATWGDLTRLAKLLHEAKAEYALVGGHTSGNQRKCRFRAAALGLVWIGGRVLYFTGYSKAVQKRLPGFFVQSAACALLFIAALVGIVLRWTSG